MRRGGSSPVGPTDLKACRRGAEWALAAAAAQELGFFDALSAGPRPPEALARDLALDPRGTGILLGILADLGLVREDPEGVRLTGGGRARFVDRDAPDYEAAAFRLWRANIRRWILEIEEAVRTGTPPEGPPRAAGVGGEEEDEEETLSRFMAAMANKAREQVERVVTLCEKRLREAGIDPGRSRALDLGGGPGTFARRLAGWGGEVVLADRPEVIDHVSEAYGLGSIPNLRTWRGDFLEAYPDGPFDLVVLANITHIYDPETNRRLLRRTAEATAPGGVVAVLDFVRGISEFASLFAITMLVSTERGNTYGRADYEAWLAEAGYDGIRLHPLDPDRQLLSARRRTPDGGGG